MTTRGFIFGKFLPPHKGHVFLCETAAGMVDELTVMVCSTEGEDIPGDTRARWMKRLLPDAMIDHFPNDLPQTPGDHPQFWRILADAIRRRHPQKFDCVFAADTYLFDLAEALDAQPVLIDPCREIFPVSGAAVRANPAAAWPMIPAPVRAHYQKRLCLLGPESVGKTRLATDLAAHFNTRVMPEYGRDYDIHYKQRKYAQGAAWRADDLVVLARTHKAMREAMRAEAGALLIEDTDAVQTAVWAAFLIGETPPALAAIAASTPADHYLLLSPDVAWSDDGVRYAGDENVRAFFFNEAERRLKTIGASYDIISGADWASRRRRAVDVIRRRFCEIV